MNAKRLYEKVMLEAERAADKQWKKERQELVQCRVRQPDSKSQQSQKQLSEIRSQTVAIERELALRKQVEVESKRNRDARLKLLEANMTPAERRARDEDIHKARVLYSKVCPELHPSWREHASEAFRNKKL
jgi:hypothetical protein